MTAGCFDILHVGHLKLLQALSQRCSLVVVGLNSDASVHRLKGDGRPFNSQYERAEMVVGLKTVSLVGLIEEDDPCELVTVVRPNVYMKGGDYDPESLIERPTVVYYGGIVVRGPMVPGRSTTALARRLCASNGQAERSHEDGTSC
jgi:D-beta-D-heptose 7-phosphate kinase/D-beta-D-heptose 1-phosphate adenosyltransferase